MLARANAYVMIHRRAAAATIARRLGNHSFRAIGSPSISRTAARSKVAAVANHASMCTTELYDRRRDEVSLDVVERIGI